MDTFVHYNKDIFPAIAHRGLRVCLFVPSASAFSIVLHYTGTFHIFSFSQRVSFEFGSVRTTAHTTAYKICHHYFSLPPISATATRFHPVPSPTLGKRLHVFLCVSMLRPSFPLQQRRSYFFALYLTSSQTLAAIRLVMAARPIGGAGGQS